ncbi:NADH-quinone oxidoreductase subunit L [Azospirillum thermophilum]|uniref:NADH-quinone oxidoreductase subunit L n=1 Tax=Azospirillum thermophilum TaxID=2202148 RepID=A0A2S2CY20_9PROT|nr:NADH-quinone oxidoreductase subunit L [Azospirillum thermophilum]AWK89381.1 NADH-quinone oxidoreductase subunit L [Azospirillum thermophilum]
MPSITLPILILLGGFLLQLLCGRLLTPAGKGVLATVAVAAAFVASLMLVPAVMRGEVMQADLLSAWDGGLSIALSVDGLSVLFMVMGTGIGAAILLFSVRYMEDEAQGTTRFYAIMLVFIAGLLVLASAADMLGAYMAWEVIGLCSYSLVGFWYKEKVATDGARKVLVITHLAGYGFLIGMVLVYSRAGSFVWTDPAVAKAFTSGVAALFIVSAMAKSVMFPLHTWIPEAMNAPTPVSALLHSACYVKAGVYLIARMYVVGDGAWHAAMEVPLLAVGCVTILVGVIFAMAQTDLKRLLAFHTVSQLGYIVVGLALGSDLGLAAGLFYCLSHALFKGTLFMCAGAIQHACGTRDLRNLGGLAAAMPGTAKIWIVAAASIAGVPLTNGFVAKWLLFSAALDKGLLAVVLIGWIGSILTAFSFLKATVNAFYGAPSQAMLGRHIHDASPSMLVGMGSMAALCLVFGLAPQLLMVPIVAPAVHSLGFDWQVQMTWLGILTDRGTIAVTVGGAVVLVSTLLGLAVYRLAHAPAAGLVSVYSGGEPLPAGDRPGAVDFAGMAEHAFHPVYSLDPDPVYLSIWRGLTAAAGRLQGLARLTLEKHPPIAVGLAAAVVLVGVFLA